jgi:uncharacterized protein YoxC
VTVAVIARAWAGLGVAVAGAAAIASEIPRPEGFWPLTVAGWIGLVIGVAAALGVIRLFVWPATAAQLRKALEEKETQRTILAIVKEGLKQDAKDLVAWQEKIRGEVDANNDRLLMIENAILQQGRAIEQMPNMVRALQRIEDQIENVTATWTRALEVMEKRGSQIDRIEGQLQAWGGEERRHRQRG